MHLGIDEARHAVSMIVGRDPKSLGPTGVARAAIESCAENFSEGVVAPAFWFAVGGLPGLIAYKAINTADSMVGHRSERYLAFGWASARLDDLLNLVPARISGVLIALVARAGGGSLRLALATMTRDASLHRSPNAGWPEAAMAGALDVALAGPRRYGNEVVDDVWMNPTGRPTAEADDIARALRINIAAWVMMLVVVLFAALLVASL
jgi:adenosylcobinamide-phosphate synthase